MIPDDLKDVAARAAELRAKYAYERDRRIQLRPQGAAQFTVWLQLHMAAMYRFTPADPARWLNGSWVRDSRYRRPAGICADTKG